MAQSFIRNRKVKYELINRLFLFSLFVLSGFTASAQLDFSTDYFKNHIDNKGYITSMKNITVKPNCEFSPVDKPSPLMSQYDDDKKVYFEPVKAVHNKGENVIILTFPNHSVARVKLEPQKKYFRMTLLTLEPRKGIEGVQWGLYHPSINNLIGKVIGVARNTSDAVNYAIGVMALDELRI